MAKPLISAVINTKNAAKTLEAALSSLTSFVDEIIVVDMDSQDKTVEIAKKFSARIFSYQPLEFADPARAYAASLATSPWVFSLDADEVVPPTLAKKIVEVLGHQPSTAVGFRMARKNIIFGAWIDAAGWWPDYQLRLFQPKKVNLPGVIHVKATAKSGRVIDLPSSPDFAIHHFNYHNLDEYLEKQQRYTKIEAEQRKTPAEIVPRVMMEAFSHEFLTRLFAQNGYTAKRHGLALALLQANYELLVSLRQWEAQGFPQSKHDGKQIIKSVSDFCRELNYWLLTQKIDTTKGLSRTYFKLVRFIKNRLNRL